MKKYKTLNDIRRQQRKETEYEELKYGKEKSKYPIFSMLGLRKSEKS